MAVSHRDVMRIVMAAVQKVFREPPAIAFQVPLGNTFEMRQERGRSSGVEHNLAKVGVVGSNPIARSNKSRYFRVFSGLCRQPRDNAGITG